MRAELSRPRTLEAAGYVAVAVYALLGALMLGALTLVVRGRFPEREAALYLTAVVLGGYSLATGVTVSMSSSSGSSPTTDHV